jgi:hypothetical protein
MAGEAVAMMTRGETDLFGDEPSFLNLEAEIRDRDERIASLVLEIEVLQGELEKAAQAVTEATQQRGGVKAVFWREANKGSVVGTADLVLSSGIVIKGCGLVRVADGQEFVSFPSRDWTDSQGKRHFQDILAFANPDVAKRFKAAALAAIKRLRDRAQLPEQITLPLGSSR